MSIIFCVEGGSEKFIKFSFCNGDSFMLGLSNAPPAAYLTHFNN